MMQRQLVPARKLHRANYKINGIKYVDDLFGSVNATDLESLIANDSPGGTPPHITDIKAGDGGKA